MPSSVDELERQLGTWRQYKSQHEGPGGAAAPGVPLGHTNVRGEPCALAGQPVGKNTKCPATKRAFKACAWRRDDLLEDG